MEILYAQSYMQTNGQMTVDILLKNPENADIVIAMDMYNTDLPPKVFGPRMVVCVPKNTPCFLARYSNIPFTNPYNIYVKRCISGPNCAINGCTTFGTVVDSGIWGEMVDFGSPGVSGVPSGVFGSPHPIPSWIQATCAPTPPPVSGLNITGVTAELSVSDLFPGSQGWTRINVTATGSGMISVLVDGTELVSESLNPGSTPFTFTYLKQLTAGTKNICVQAVGGNKVCTSITVPGVVIRKDSCMTINTRNTPPFKKGENVAIYGILEECGGFAPDINDASIIIKIKINSTEVKSYATKTYASTSIGENWSYVWQVPSTYGASLDTAGKNITVEAYYYGDAVHGPIAKISVIGTIEAVAPPPPTGFTVSADKIAITSGDYVVFSGTYKPGMKVGIYSNKGYITTTVTNVAGGFKVGEVVTIPISDTTKQTLTIYACAEGAISGICPLLADKSNNINMDVTPKAIVPPPPVPEATHAFLINLSPLSWASLDGLISYLPNITTEFAKAITLYGWLGWEVIISRIEDSNKLVIYLRETASVSGMGRLSETASEIRVLALPALAAVIAALGTVTTIALRFGYIILGFSIVNLATKAVEVSQTQADTEQIRTETISDMCKSGELTPEQCAEALKPPPEKGICGTLGLSAATCDQLKTGALVAGALIGAVVIYKIVKPAAK